MFQFKKQSGQASRLLLVLAVVILVAVIIVYLVMKMAEQPPEPVVDQEIEDLLPVYEKTLGDIRFVYLSAIDQGDSLKASNTVNEQYSFAQKDLGISNPGAKFVEVIVGAQNRGTRNIERSSWGIGNIVDSEGRNYVPLENSTVVPWIPNPDLCGELLKPAFDPTPCKKIYEISKESIGLKIQVKTGTNNTASNYASGKIDEFLIDLIVK